MHSVINQRQCHEQCKLGGTLCLVLLVTNDTAIHRNIDTQTFNDYKLLSLAVLCGGYIMCLLMNVWVSVFPNNLIWTQMSTFSHKKMCKSM